MKVSNLEQFEVLQTKQNIVQDFDLKANLLKKIQYIQNSSKASFDKYRELMISIKRDHLEEPGIEFLQLNYHDLLNIDNRIIKRILPF